MPTSASLLSTYFVSVFQGFSFSLSFRAARMKNVLACLMLRVFRQSVSQSLSLSVCLAAAAAQAPSLNVLRCCSRVAKKNGTTQNSNSTSTSNSIAFGNFPCAQVALAKCVQREILNTCQSNYWQLSRSLPLSLAASRSHTAGRTTSPF